MKLNKLIKELTQLSNEALKAGQKMPEVLVMSTDDNGTPEEVDLIIVQDIVTKTITIDRA